MHMNGSSRSCYRSWQQFTRALLARFGELETELVFDKLKRLQQFTTVEWYFDEFVNSRGKLLNKFSSYTQEYLLPGKNHCRPAI